MTRPAYDAAPYEPNADRQLRKTATAIDRINAGKFNCTVDVTLRASQTTTVVTDARIGPFSFIMWMPMTANASTAEKAGIWCNPTVAGSVTLNHASAVAVDQTFRLVILA